MQEWILLAVVVISLFCGTKSKSAGAAACNRVSKVEIHYRDYFDIYLGHNDTTNKSSGFYHDFIKEAARDCCNHLNPVFVKVNATNDTELLTLTALENYQATVRRPFVFYFPEFAEGKEKIVYDYELNFVKLSRSPGQAVVMLTPSSKKQVSLLDIFKESIPIIVFMLALSWVVGILGWLADHWKNPEEFPSPFILGMFEGFWWAIVTMTTVGYGDKAPRSVPARILAVIWVMISAVILSLFTANATTILSRSLEPEDYAQTIGKKIGVLQSKEFAEFQLNMGAQLINFDNFKDMDMALNRHKIDRFLFPDYKDLLWLLKTYYQEGADKYQIAKVFESPFQVGMVLAIVPEMINTDDMMFLKCLRTGISYREKSMKQLLDYASIVFPKKDKEDGTTALNQDSLLKLTYYMLAAIACLACFGIAWDLWKCHMKRRTSNTGEDVVVESGQVNDVISPTVESYEDVTAHEKNDATWF